jgi:predicted nucleic acid-binding protein
LILFCDTSALLKLYLDEPESATLHDLANAAEDVVACRIAWAEAWAGFARKGRETPIALAAIATARSAFAEDWPRWSIIEVTQTLVEQAGSFAEAFALRGYDSVQLAAAHSAIEQRPEVSFASFDARLNRAARVLGMRVPLLAP